MRGRSKVFIGLSVIAIIYILMIVTFSFISPDIPKSFFAANNISGGFITNLLFVWENVNHTIDHVYPGILKLFLLTTLSLSLYAWFVLSQGKNILEVFLLFIVYIIPRPKEYWGKVQDKNNFNVIPFSVLRVMRKAENGDSELFVKETISDLFGRYRLHIDKEAGFEYFLYINAKDYKTLKRDLKGGSDKSITLYDDIYLEPMIISNENPAKRLANSIRKHMNKNISNYLYLASLLSLLVTIRPFLLTVVPIGNYIELTQYIVAVIINTRRIYILRTAEIGKVIQYDQRKSISNVNFQLRKGGEIIDRKASDRNGVLNFDAKPGIYQLELVGNQYTMVSSNGNNEKDAEVIISDKGYLRNNVVLKALNATANSQPSGSMLNPFQ